jgi:hypothetical protein
MPFFFKTTNKNALLMNTSHYLLKKIKMLLLLLILFISAVANSTTVPHEGWIKAVEDVLAHIVMGPLQPALRPTAFSQRNRTQVVHVQANHFRAHVLQNMLQSLEERVEVCPWPPHVGQEAVQMVVAELKSLEFQASWENKPHWRCPGYGGYLLVHVPVPSILH